MLNRRSEQCINCESCNQHSPLFSLLNQEELKITNAGRFEVTYNSGETIVKQGTSATHLIVLTNGMAKLFLEGVDKRNLIMDIVLPRRLFGGPGIFTDNRYHYSVIALTETSACFISTESVRKVFRSNPDFAEAMLKHCNRGGASNFDRLISLTQKQMPGRLADTLLYLRSEVYHSTAFTLDITRQEMGEMSNMTKESTTRILKDFETEGILKIDGKTIELLNIEALKGISLHG